MGKQAGKDMTRDEEMEMLGNMRDFFCAMSDDELFDYFYEHSPSFKKDIDAVRDDFGNHLTQDIMAETRLSNNNVAYMVSYTNERSVKDSADFYALSLEVASWQMIA